MLSPSDPAVSLEPFGLVHPPSSGEQCTDWGWLLISLPLHSPSHETGDHVVRLDLVEPGGAHAVVNWSFSI